MDRCTKEIGSMGKKTDKENSSSQMVTIKREFGQMINFNQDKLRSLLKIVIPIKVAGNPVRCKAMEF
jgi:hypothetical protein